MIGILVFIVSALSTIYRKVSEITLRHKLGKGFETLQTYSKVIIEGSVPAINTSKEGYDEIRHPKTKFEKKNIRTNKPQAPSCPSCRAENAKRNGLGPQSEKIRLQSSVPQNIFLYRQAVEKVVQIAGQSSQSPRLDYLFGPQIIPLNDSLEQKAV